MGDFLKGNKFSTTYQQVVCVGDSSADGNRGGVHASTQKIVWTDDGADSKNLLPFTVATSTMRLNTTKKIEFNDAGVYIHSSSDGILTTSADGSTVIGTALFDLNASAGITIDGTTIAIAGTGASSFTATGGNLTLSTATSGEMFLTPVNYIQVATGKKLQFGGANDYLSGTGSVLTVGSGGDINLTPAGSSDVNIPAGKGLVFDSNDSEKIESDDTDLTISSGGDINLTATNQIVVPANVEIELGDAAEYVSGDGTDLTVASSADINLTASADINIPASVGLTIGADTNKLEYTASGTHLDLDSAGFINVKSTKDGANALYLHADGGTAETIKIHADQGITVSESAPSILLLSDAGGIGVRSTSNLANAINLTVDGGTTSSMTLFNDTGNSVTEGSASIQLLSDVGGIGIKSTSGLANAILLTTDGGTDETIKLHSDQGTGADSIELTSDDGGIDVNAAAGTVAVDALVLSLDSTTTSNLTMAANTASTQTLTVSATNANGSNVSDLLLNSDGTVHIRADKTTNTYAGAGIQIGTDLSGVDVAIGHTTSDVRVGDNLVVTGDVAVGGDLDVTGALTYGSVAITTQDISHTAPYMTFTNTTEENNNMDDSSDNALGRESKILFKGEKADGTVHELATMQVGHEGTGDDKKGQIQFFTNSGALSDGALALAMTIADTGYIGIGTAAPEEQLHVHGDFVITNAADADAQLLVTHPSNSPNLRFTDSAGLECININSVPTASSYINTGGNFGIGTDSPEMILQVRNDHSTAYSGTENMATSASEGLAGLGVSNLDGSADYSSIRLGTRASGTSVWDIVNEYTGANVGDLVFKTRTGATTAAEMMRMKNNGNVGIGTASPERALDVESTSTQLRLSYNSTYFCEMQVSSGGDLYFLDRAGTNNLTITDAGTVGIGTASPNGSLQIVQTGAFSREDDSTTNNLVLSRTQSAGDDVVGGSIAFTELNNEDEIRAQIAMVQTGTDKDECGLGFYVHPSTAQDDPCVEAMRIKMSGYVGIGTTEPQSALTISGSLDVNLLGEGDKYLTLIRDDSQIDDDDEIGSIWFGATENSYSAVGYGASIVARASQAWDDIGNASSGDHGADLEFYTVGNTNSIAQVKRMVISNSGNVGIGAASPGHPLEVVGGGDGNYVALFDNSGTGSTAHGISISAGDADHADSDTHYIQFLEHDSDVVGELDSDGGSLALSDTSDKRLKKNIRDTKTKGLEIINGARMRDFEWKKNKLAFNCGVIAQELQEVFPKAVKEGDDKNKTLRVRKTDFIYVLVKAVQELSAKVTALENA